MKKNKLRGLKLNIDLAEAESEIVQENGPPSHQSPANPSIGKKEKKLGLGGLKIDTKPDGSDSARTKGILSKIDDHIYICGKKMTYL